MKKCKKILTIFIFGVFLILSTLSSFILYKVWTKLKNETGSQQPQEVIKEEAVKTEEKSITPGVIIKDSAQLVVPYTVQAPYANWAVHEESCEEAAALMYHYFLSKESFSPNNVIPPEKASTELTAMKNWQKVNYGIEPDLNLEKFGQFVKSYYGHNYAVTKNITETDIKKEISQGRPVIVPVITHGLENPHYGRLPSYHLLLIIGYDANGVITNDAGIKEGQNYKYSWSILFSAIDAQTPQMKQGRDMIVFY